MSYKSILTYSDSEAETEKHLSVAIDLTRRLDAHLAIAALGCDPDVPPTAFAGSPGVEMAEMYARSRERAQDRVREMKALIEREGVKAEATSLVSTYSGLPRAFGGLARFSDLVILGQPSVSGSEQVTNNLIEGALFDGDAPALICPASMPKMPGKAVVIGWNGDREALRAVRKAMPLLQQANTVEIAVVDPSGVEGEPGADLALLLARHGVDVEINVPARAGQSVSEVLRQRARDRDADLLVMGAYGHSRFREYVLGGVTRDILADTPVPVLMAH